MKIIEKMAGSLTNLYILQEITSKMYDLLFAKTSDDTSKTPQQKNKKKRLTAIPDTDDEESFLQRKSKSPNTTKSGRPGRAAKIKAENNLVGFYIYFMKFDNYQKHFLWTFLDI